MRGCVRGIDKVKEKNGGGKRGGKGETDCCVIG